MQDVAALQASLDHAAAAAVVQAEQITDLCTQHNEQLEALRADLERKTNQRLQAANEGHHLNMQHQQYQFQHLMQQTLQDLRSQLRQLEDQQQQAVQDSSDLPRDLQTYLDYIDKLQAELQGLLSECLGSKKLLQQLVVCSQQQQVAMHALMEQVAKVAPEGLQALQHQLDSAR